MNDFGEGSNMDISGQGGGANASQQNSIQHINQQHNSEHTFPTNTNANININSSTNTNRYSLPQIFDANALPLPSITVDSGGHDQMLYQQALEEVANMAASASKLQQGVAVKSPLPSSSNQPQPPSAMAAPQVVGSKQTVTRSVPNPFAVPQQTISTTLGGVEIPPLPANSSTAMQVQVAAAAAAAAAAPPKGYHGPKPGSKEVAFDGDSEKPMTTDRRGTKRGGATIELSSEERKNLNRERNREHAKSTRARKKAYVNKLKELVDGLHAERSEEARKRRVAVQHLAEVQRVRRTVIKTFLKFHANYQADPRKWSPILEDTFFLKQPVTPYRSFRKLEIINTTDRQECRITKGIDPIICDSASVAVMVENIGNRSARWKHIKHDEFLKKEEARTGTVQSRMPRNIMSNNRMQHAISSMSSSSGYSTGTGSSGDEDKKKVNSIQTQPVVAAKGNKDQEAQQPKKVSSSSSGGSSEQAGNHLYHDYHAKPLPDPKLDSAGSSGSDSLPSIDNDSDNAVVGKHLCTDSSSGDEEKPRKAERKKRPIPPTLEITTDQGGGLTNTVMRASMEKKDNYAPQPASVTATDPSQRSHSSSENGQSAQVITSVRSTLPPNIARSGGISHNIRPVVSAVASNPRLNTAPIVPLPPFVGLGKRSQPLATKGSNISHSSSSGIISTVRPATVGSLPIATSVPPPKSVQATPGAPTEVAKIVVADHDAGSSVGTPAPQIQAFYHVNEDDMLITDDVLMCPYIFRTQDAVLCGALAECVMPGMLRAQFSSRNKLLNLEMVYDAMGFMQQLGRASGNESVAEIIPNSIEISLQPNSEQARVVTTAKPPYPIVSVNGRWTKLTKFTQMEAEKKDLTIIEGERTDPGMRNCPGKPNHDLGTVAEGKSACSTNVYYDKYGKAFVAFVTTYPLTNSSDEITHLLHIYNELKEFS